LEDADPKLESANRDSSAARRGPEALRRIASTMNRPSSAPARFLSRSNRDRRARGSFWPRTDAPARNQGSRGSAFSCLAPCANGPERAFLKSGTPYFGRSRDRSSTW